MHSKVRNFSLVAAILLAALPTTAQTTIRSITRYRVTPDRAPDFEAAIKDYNAVLKQAGFARVHTAWLSATGPRGYARVSFRPNYASFDTSIPDDPKLKDHDRQLVSIVSCFNACVENSDRIIEEVLRDLSITSSENPALVRVVRLVARPGRANDLLNLIKTDVFPAARQSGLKLYHISQTRYGGPSSEFRAMAGWDNWADFDGPTAIAKAMGAAKFARYQEKLAPLIVESQSDIYRYMPELSYIPVH